MKEKKGLLLLLGIATAAGIVVLASRKPGILLLPDETESVEVIEKNVPINQAQTGNWSPRGMSQRRATRKIRKEVCPYALTSTYSKKAKLKELREKMLREKRERDLL